MNESAVKAQGAYEAWNDLLSLFTDKQRQELANMMAHGWAIGAIRIERNGCRLVYTPDGVHGRPKNKLLVKKTGVRRARRQA